MIRSKPSLLLAILALAISLPAEALQRLTARDGESVLARISQKDVTRIGLAHGRIRKVTGNAGEFFLEKDDDKGEIFIRPVAADATKPISLFLTTDHGTVGLLLQPVDAPGESIVIREARDPAQTPARHPRSERHIRALKNLLLALASDAIPEDMAMREPHQELQLWAGFRLTLVRVLLGSHIVAEKYRLANLGLTEATLDPRELYKPGVMAVSIEGESLEPGEAANVFVIREPRPND